MMTGMLLLIFMHHLFGVFMSVKGREQIIASKIQIYLHRFSATKSRKKQVAFQTLAIFRASFYSRTFSFTVNEGRSNKAIKWKKKFF